LNILAIYGSPNKQGNTAMITDSIIGSIGESNYSERVYLYDKRYEDCMACQNAENIHKKQYCIFIDDFTNYILPKINKADLLIISSPVYMGQITGKLKTLFDRWHTYITDDYSIRILPGKKFITVTTSAAPTERFQNVSDYLNSWLSDFFKMEKLASFHVGDLMESGSLMSNSQVLKEAKNLGSTF